MKKIRIGLIGLGMIAKHHIRAYMEHAEEIDGVLVALCDTEEELLQKWGKATGVSKLYTDYHDMLNDDEVDAVMVLTPHHLHYQMTVDAANAGKHIGVEKCFATKLSDADEMIAASKANAIKQLQELLECDRVVAFGDGRNDIDMFELADESYAVQNADEQLKRYATSVISSNDEDGVAHWLEDNYIVK